MMLCTCLDDDNDKNVNNDIDDHHHSLDLSDHNIYGIWSSDSSEKQFGDLRVCVLCVYIHIVMFTRYSVAKG